jgi:hypothetical protein
MAYVTAKTAITASVPADVGKRDEYVAGECGKRG